MDNLYCVCGIANHEIYIASKDNPMAVPVVATKSAIMSVRDYMVDAMKEGDRNVAYQWKRKDGKTVKLICVIEG